METPTFEFGDFLRAVRLLDAGGNALSRQAIAEALGLQLAVYGPVPQRPPERAKTGRELGNRSAVAHESPRTNEIPAELRYLDEASASLEPPWLKETESFDPPSPNARFIPAKPSLLTPAWTRALLVAALSTTGESGEIDVAALIARVSAGNAIERLPMVSVATLARGVHCWVDSGPAMEPFTQDQRQLVLGLLNVAGASRVSVHTFSGIPDREGSFVRGAPHLVLSDLGKIPLPRDVRGVPASDRQWIEFARWVKQHLEGQAIVLAPISARKFSVALRRDLLILSWDRRTSVQTARRAMSGMLWM